MAILKHLLVRRYVPVAVFVCAALTWTGAAAEEVPRPRAKPQVRTMEALIAEVSAPGSEDLPASAAKVPAPAKPAASPVAEASAANGPRAKPTDVAPTGVLSRAEHEVFETALEAALGGDFSRAHAAADTLSNKAARTLIEWIHLRSSGSVERIVGFLDNHPDWPDESVLRTRAEGILYGAPVSARSTIAYFAKYPPLTGTGMLALAAAYLEAGDRSKAAAAIARAWREDELSAGLERRALELCRSCISDTLDKERLDRMAYLGEFSAARRAAERLGSAPLTLVSARAALTTRSSNAESRYSKAVKQYKDDVGLALSRVTWLRRKDKDIEARKILVNAPSDPAIMLEPSAWWTERRLVARRALGDPEAWADAYRITASHGLTSGKDFAAAEFLAGWIALRKIGDAALAEKHFMRLRQSVETPISVARAEYWLGRAAEARGRKDQASKHYTAAARHGVTFYGQLARERVVGPGAILDLPEIDAATYAAGAAIESEPLMQAARLLSAAGERRLASRFLLELADHTDSPGGLDRIAKLANTLALPHVAVRIGKIGIAKGAPVHEVAYPVDDYPRLSPAPDVEFALLLALTRQESEFNWQASSGVGARGLMQVMPATGKELARHAGVEFSLTRLGGDPQYNASLGARYLADRIAEFEGSYVLAIASYNAGPGRVREWIDMLGDPRDEAVDPIDWIETIPFDETRNYVQRVLENLQVYRARLAGGAVPLELTADLMRGRGGIERTAAND